MAVELKEREGNCFSCKKPGQLENLGREIVDGREKERAGDWMRILYPWGIMSPCYMASMETTKVGIALMTFEVAKLV